MTPKKAVAELAPSWRDGLQRVLRAHIKKPEDVNYSTDLTSQIDTDGIVDHIGLLKSIREVLDPQVTLPQAALKDEMAVLANEREVDWKLSEQSDSWAAETAKSIRAMLRHLQQAVLKATTFRDKIISPSPCDLQKPHSGRAVALGLISPPAEEESSGARVAQRDLGVQFRGRW
eukprot:6490059-Pyramimonas_sp.AAC.2